MRRGGGGGGGELQKKKINIKFTYVPQALLNFYVTGK